jgi:hypothetical protein
MADGTRGWTEPGGAARDSTQPFDIFLSHRGPDTKDFCRGLKDALEKKGYSTFLDDTDIQKASNGWDNITGNLRRAKVVIVVLSKGFGRSQYCLDELVIAVEDGRKNRVLPAFYDVKPGDVHTLLADEW